MITNIANAAGDIAGIGMDLIRDHIWTIAALSTLAPIVAVAAAYIL